MSQPGRDGPRMAQRRGACGPLQYGPGSELRTPKVRTIAVATGKAKLVGLRHESPRHVRTFPARWPSYRRAQRPDRSGESGRRANSSAGPDPVSKVLVMPRHIVGAVSQDRAQPERRRRAQGRQPSWLQLLARDEGSDVRLGSGAFRPLAHKSVRACARNSYGLCGPALRDRSPSRHRLFADPIKVSAGEVSAGVGGARHSDMARLELAFSTALWRCAPTLASAKAKP